MFKTKSLAIKKIWYIFKMLMWHWKNNFPENVELVDGETDMTKLIQIGCFFLLSLVMLVTEINLDFITQNVLDNKL